MRVLRADGTPLPNLLAAGGAAGGVSGDAVWGYLSGNGLLSAVAGGCHRGAHGGRAPRRRKASTMANDTSSRQRLAVAPTSCSRPASTTR